MVYITYFRGGHLRFCSLAELAHIFTRWCIAYFFKNLPLKPNQSSKIDSEKVVTDSIGFASTILVVLPVLVRHILNKATILVIYGNSICLMYIDTYFFLLYICITVYLFDILFVSIFYKCI